MQHRTPNRQPSPRRIVSMAWGVACAVVLALAVGPDHAAAAQRQAKAAATAKAGKASTGGSRVVAGKGAPSRIQASKAGRKGKGKGRAAGPTVVHMPSPPAATLAALELATVRTGCVGPADPAPLGYPADQVQGWLGGPPDAASSSAVVPACRRYAAVSLAGTATEPATLALLAFGGTRALLVTRAEGRAEPATEWLEIDPEAHGLRELWLPSALGASALEQVPPALHNELVLLSRTMRKQSGAPEGALLRVWLQGEDEGATMEALELVDAVSGQAYDSAVWLARTDGSGAYISSRGVEYERMLWQAPVDHLRISRGIGASSMLVHKRTVVMTRTKKGPQARTHRRAGLPVQEPARGHRLRGADGHAGGGGGRWRDRVRRLARRLRQPAAAAPWRRAQHLLRPPLGLRARRAARMHVRRGQMIGLVGSTGFSTGPHLHFEIRKGDRYIDPTRPDVQLPAWTLQREEHPHC